VQLHVCGQIKSVCNSEIIIKGQFLRKWWSNEKGSSFFTHSTSASKLAVDCRLYADSRMGNDPVTRCTSVDWLTPNYSYIRLYWLYWALVGNIPTGTPYNGASNVGSMKKSRLSTNISLYFGNHTGWGYNYYGTPIETCMRSIEWYSVGQKTGLFLT